jgi:hypothetical protein
VRRAAGERTVDRRRGNGALELPYDLLQLRYFGFQLLHPPLQVFSFSRFVDILLSISGCKTSQAQ